MSPSKPIQGALLLLTLLYLAACGGRLTPAQDSKECTARTIYVKVPEPAAESIVLEQEPPVVNIEAPEAITEIAFIHRGSACTTTVVSVDDKFFAIYSNMLLPLKLNKYTDIRTMRVGSDNYMCKIKIDKDSIPIQKLEAL